MTMPEVERLLVVSPTWLGDAVMALPAIADLRRRFPAARLIMAARRAIAGLFTMTPVVDEVIVMEWSGRIWARRSRFADIAALRTNIPESGSALPVVLDEALFNVRWMLTMQDPADGGVYHKLTNAAFDAFIERGYAMARQMSWDAVARD